MSIATYNSHKIQPHIRIGNIIRDAVVFDFKKWRENMPDTNLIIQNVSNLFRMLDERKIKYVLVGGVAMLQFVEGRNTQHIDLIMALSSLKKLPEIKIISRDVYFIRGKIEELQVDILLTKNPLFKKIQQRYSIQRPFEERKIPCATVEGLLLLKLYALPSLYRQGSFVRVSIYENDIAALIHEFQPQLEPIFDELAVHLSETDLKSIKEIIQDIQLRIKRFNSSQFSLRGSAS